MRTSQREQRKISQIRVEDQVLQDSSCIGPQSCSSFTAAAACRIGLQYARSQPDKDDYEHRL